MAPLVCSLLACKTGMIELVLLVSQSYQIQVAVFRNPSAKEEAIIIARKFIQGGVVKLLSLFLPDMQNETLTRGMMLGCTGSALQKRTLLTEIERIRPTVVA